LFVVEVKNDKRISLIKFVNDLSLATASHPVRIYKIEEGKFGIEVPHKNFKIIHLKDYLEKIKKDNFINIPIGEDCGGNMVYKKLDSFLISGATNSGKSFFLHSFIVSLLSQKDKNNIEFLFIDPKRVELSFYRPFGEYIQETKEAKIRINEIKKEVDRRFELLGDNQINNIETYNSKFSEKLSNIVVIIDEFSDLIITDKEFFEDSVSFIASCGNVVGVNILVATSRPDPVDILPKKIVDSFRNVVCSATATKDNSITIIGQSGGEKLLGQGDVLFQEFDYDIKEQDGKQCMIDKKEKQIRRLQVVFMPDNEIQEFIKKLL